MAPADFEAVLRLAASGKEDARQELMGIVKSSDGEEARLAARRILSLWDEDEGTFFTRTPMPVHHECVGADDLLSLREMLTTTTYVDLEVTVSVKGTVERIVVKRGSGNREADALIVSNVAKRRFIPAKPGAAYAVATLRLMCRIEAR